MKQILAISIAFWIGYAMCYFTKCEKLYKQGREFGIQSEKSSAQAFRDSIRNACTYGNVIDTLYAVDRKAINDNFPKPNLKKMIGE